uniref:CIP2A N-terminal domain-containing protein n=1 Tax=Globisporangium ultimum (strain ATCC 200006 / CBS 805.95 / DAOM BR144) TaxID=431595 RepID=K3WJU7_GLOUD
MEISDAELTRTSFGSSSSYGVKKSVLPKTKFLAAVDDYLVAPSSDTLTHVHQLTRKLTSEVVFFSAQHTTLCLRLLDTLSEHLLSVAQSAEASQSQATYVVDEYELLELIYLFAKNTAIGYPSHALGKLLQWLVANIVTSGLSGGACENETTLKLQLLVFAEMLKVNAGVRIYTKETKHIKEFYRALTILLNSTEDAELLVFSMTILARLVLAESLGAKLFSQKNVEQAFELAFSILDGSWQNNTIADGRSGALSILNVKSLLQCVSVDLMCELAEQPEILGMLENHPKMSPVVENFFMVLNLNGDIEQIQVGIHFLSSIVALGHQFRKLMVKFLSDEDVLYRVLQVTLHPSKMIGILTTQLVLKIIGDDVRPIRSLFDSALQVQRLNPVIVGLFRCINEAAGLVQQKDNLEKLSTTEEYLHSVEVCQVLAKLCEFPALRSMCVQTINLNQSATIIQLESAHIGSGEPQRLLQFQPRLSLNLVILLSKLVHDLNMNDKTKRTLSQFLQSSEVSLVLGAGVFNRNDKDLVVETLLLVYNLLSESSNKRFLAFGLADGILNFGQRIGEATESLQSTISSLEANGEASMKVIEKLQIEIQQTIRLQDEAKAKQDQELQNLKSKFIDQVRQKDELLMKTKEVYEAKLRELSAQCETMGQLMNKKIITIQHRDQILQESRAKQAAVEDENSELKRKVEVLEIRIEEIAQSHSIAAEEMRIREREMHDLREEMVSISSDYTVQREELEHAREEMEKLEQELKEKAFEHENTYKELVLLSKAHKTVIQEKEGLAGEIETLRDEVSNMESMNLSMQTRLQERKDLIEQLEKKIARLDDAASIAQSAVEDERNKRRAVARDLEDLRKAHRKLESDIAMLEIRAAEHRLVLESKDDHLRKCEEEIRHLNNEVGKQVKLQALIHQLSSGGDAQAYAATSFLARDS